MSLVLRNSKGEKMKVAAVCVLFVVAMAHLMVKPTDALTCQDVTTAVAPCVPFITGLEAKPAAGCCSGINHLKALAPTKTDRQAACDCMKAAAANLRNLNDAAVSSLPVQCGTPLPVPINKNIDCKTYYDALKSYHSLSLTQVQVQ
ncbi:hypothetical protein ACLOJK_021751 [Asimina triloba]